MFLKEAAGWCLVIVAGGCAGAGVAELLTPLVQLLAEQNPALPLWWLPETASGFAAVLGTGVLGWSLLEGNPADAQPRTPPGA